MEPFLPSEPSPPPVHPRTLPFFAMALLLYALPGQMAQASSLVPGLAWSEVFVFLLPATIFAAGANLRPATFLLLDRRPTVAQLLLGFLCGVASFAVAGALATLSSLLLPRRWLEIFDVSRLFQGPLVEQISLSILAATLAPLCEEAAFRGYVQNALLARFSPRAAIAASAFLFAAMHLDPVRFAAVFVLGALFGWIAWRSGSLWPAVAAHAANNGIAAALTVAGLGETSPEAASARSALWMLVLGSVPLLLLMAAYRAATPLPPAPETARVRLEPATASAGFRFRFVPTWLVAAAAVGAALLVLIVTLGHPRAR